ncbi:NAD(P)/FAD-dependent oxidoreductase [Rubellimicrobium aerolatum]|uniref:NAD(P)/FAD-dependent oxidoreductase n=1 Tax=Rubellimicrobium aerolatum TaxID=490979 RepID=A0ABW0SDF6_9RHOB|nr:FAD-dependent oxidoreductase [Rubellimicrobium aerolatum]MBP1805766.1 glycine/D-amino acid oxidase-like deaminating enzyme [Rubellimicrobium aerolatum]
MTDFLVIGGGIAGVSAAARLSRLGSVILLEAEDRLAHHASSRSAAVFEGTYGAPSTVALNRASRAELEARGVLAPRGLMVVARPEENAAFEADLRQMEMEEVPLDAARERLPILGPAVARAAVQADTLDLDTDRLLQGFLREAKANGARVLTRAPVTAIRRAASGWVAAAGEDHEARVIVNAAGPWADRIAALAGLPPLELRPFRRSMARIPAPSNPSRWPMVVGAGESFYMKPDAGALLVSPAEEDPAEPHDAWADDLVLAEGLARFEAHVAWEVERLLASWAGLRTFAPDRRLVLGPDTLEPSFLWCAGQGGYGFQTACAASRHLAELAGGAAPTLGPGLAAELAPARFR